MTWDKAPHFFNFKKWDGGPANLYRPLHFYYFALNTLRKKPPITTSLKFMKIWQLVNTSKKWSFQKPQECTQLIFTEGRYFSYLEKNRYLHIRCNRIDWSGQSEICNPTFTYNLQLEMQEKIIPFISQLFWEIDFFPYTLQIFNWTTLLLLMHRSCTDAFVWKFILWTIDPQKDTPTSSTSHPRNKQNGVYFGVMNGEQGE